MSLPRVKLRVLISIGRKNTQEKRKKKILSVVGNKMMRLVSAKVQIVVEFYSVQGRQSVGGRGGDRPTNISRILLLSPEI